MKLIISIITLFCALQNLNAQDACIMDSTCSYIRLEDNTGKMNVAYIYYITSDSLFIKGVSDYGRTRVNYLARILTSEEKKRFADFLSGYPFDLVQEKYFNDYSNYTFIDYENFPRAMKLNLRKGNHEISSEMTNAWVGVYDLVLQHLNTIVPAEVKITYDKSAFTAFY